MSLRQRLSDPRLWSLLLLTAGAVLMHHLIFGELFPNDQGKLGHDYSLFLPHLLDGWLWSQHNSLLGIRWFSPSFCGGVPVFANPQNVFHTLTQWLTLWMDPLAAVYATLLIFGGLGFAGTLLLLRGPFGLATPWALIGAVLFQFNGFFSYRLAIGGLPSHSVMLLPLVAFFLLRREDSFPGWRGQLLNSIPAGLLLTYMFWAASNTQMLPYGLGLMMVMVLQRLARGPDRGWGPWLRLGVAVALTGLLSAPKMHASMALLQQFPRDHYSLPGAKGVAELLWLAFQSLFLKAPSWADTQPLLANYFTVLERHEWEYGLTWIALLLLLGGGTGALLDWKARPAPAPRSWAWAGLLLLLMAIPLAVNLYTPDWNALLKRMPVIANSTTLFRWFAGLMLPLAVLAALAATRLPVLARWPWPLALAVAGGVWGIHATTERNFYHQQPYDPNPVVTYYRAAKPVPWTPMIQSIGMTVNAENKPATGVGSNDGLIRGMSIITCYEPMFGYGLERFPWQPLAPGPVNRVTDGKLNIKNPACYMAPRENQCHPGAHFSSEQWHEALNFMSYKPFAFEPPKGHQAVVAVALTTLAVLAAFLLWVLASRRQTDTGGAA
ncbi:MAG: hypothetical protein HQL82_10275 [Magnetococcales bacterium]|nr:hypothetical protein [Magnetococcales bacterium]